MTRTPEAEKYRKLYKTHRWEVVRADQLNRRPLCEWCEDKGIIRGATVAHHAVPHRGDLTKFFDSKLISLCSDCHDITAHRMEARGYSDDIDETTGWPTDPNHPANTGGAG